jgi:PAS domain S-box-containing protein
MAWSLKTKKAVGVTVLTFGVVAVTTALHLAQLTRVVVQEARQQADLVAKQMYAQASRALAAAAQDEAPADVLRRDRVLRSLVDASIGYSPHLVYALIADRAGTVLVHSQSSRELALAPTEPELDQLLALDPVRRFLTLYARGRTYETVLPVTLGGAPFGTVRLGLSTSLLRRELHASVTQSLALAALVLPVAWLLAMALANIALGPIRQLTQDVDRVRRGEFEVGADLARKDEVGELAAQLQLLSQDLQSDRVKTLADRAELQHVVDILEDGIIFFTPDGRILSMNKAAAQVLGRSPDEAAGGRLEDLLAPEHPVRLALQPALSRRMELRNAPLHLEIEGRTRECLMSALFVSDVHREVGAMVLLRDLESIRTLQSLISYSAKLAALGRLTSGLAHEVKNPLNAMMIHLEIARERITNVPVAQTARESLDVIGQEIRRLDRVVQGFLKFARPQELALKPVDANALLQEVAALVEAEWQAVGVRIVLRLDPGCPRLSADEELLRQAFLNVLQNACQAMPEGGRIVVATETRGRDALLVRIADEGVGIPAHELDRIFTLYYTTKPEGSGIGLSLVYRIIQMHDGTIQVDSLEGRGTTMTIELPVR